MISIGIVKFLTDGALMWFRWAPSSDDTSENPSGIIYPKIYPTYESAAAGNEEYLYNFNTCTHELEDVVLYPYCVDDPELCEPGPMMLSVKACRRPECMLMSYNPRLGFLL